MLDYLLKNVNGTDFKQLNPKHFEFKERGVIRQFCQKEFFNGDEEKFKKSDFKKTGGLYFPHTCLYATKNCNIHVSLSGCWGGNDYWA